LTIWVADFGFAVKRFDMMALNVKCGTATYMDPSILNGHPYTE
jgi:serine/threonine protein kinase